MYNEKFLDSPMKFLAIQKVFVVYYKKNLLFIFISNKKSAGHMLKIFGQIAEVFRNLDIF